MYPDQQRFWIALLNLQRTWATDDAALAFIPPRFRDFESTPDWTWPKAQAFLLNNLELLRESYRQLEAGEPPDYDGLNQILGGLHLRLQPWTDPATLKQAAAAKAELGGRLEILQVTSELEHMNPGTRYIRATIQRAFYYFAQYVDDRLSDPAYPGITAGRARVRLDIAGDLALVDPQAAPTSPGDPA